MNNEGENEVENGCTGETISTNVMIGFNFEIYLFACYGMGMGNL